jgi:hypothetical protein
LSILICGPDFTLFEQIARITSFSAGVAEPQASKTYIGCVKAIVNEPFLDR